MSRLFSLRQAVDEIGPDVVTVAQLTEWCKQSRIPCRKVGRKWAMSSDDITEFLEKSFRPATAGEPQVVTEFSLTPRSKRSA